MKRSIADVITAAAKGDIKYLETCDQDKFDFNGEDANGTTPLIAAARSGQTKAVYFLIQRGAFVADSFYKKQSADAIASLGIAAQDGAPPKALLEAVKYGHTSVVLLLNNHKEIREEYLGKGKSTPSTLKRLNDIGIGVADPVTSHYPKTIIDIFKDAKHFSELPVLDIDKRTGETGYLDFVKPEEMTASIMRGTDLRGRGFLCVRTQNNRTKEQGVTTFFYRHISEDGMPIEWTSAGRHPKSSNPFSFYSSSSDQQKNEITLNQLVHGKVVDGYSLT